MNINDFPCQHNDKKDANDAPKHELVSRGILLSAVVVFESFPLHHKPFRPHYQEVYVKLFNFSNTSRTLDIYGKKRRQAEYLIVRVITLWVLTLSSPHFVCH